MFNKLIKKLLFDCLHEILENLENDITALHSCLSVNRLLCEISVRILWKVVVEYSVNITYQPMSIVLKTILINCQYLELIKIQYGDDFDDLNELMLYNSKFDFVHSRKLLTLIMILSDDFDNEYYEVQRQLYCNQCSPIDSIPVDNIPDGLEVFWLWISIQYTTKEYTGATIATFKVLKDEIASNAQSNILISVTTRIIQSIKFCQITISLLELSFYLHKLFELTNGFK